MDTTSQQGLNLDELCICGHTRRKHVNATGVCVGECQAQCTHFRRILTADPDPVNHPPHYTFAPGFEVADVIDAWSLDFHLGNAVKYIARHLHKGEPLEDLLKARWYLERAIGRLEKEQQS